MDKYLQTKSLTWWVSFIPLIAGAILYLSAVFPGMQGVIDAIHVIYPNADAGVLINLGLAGIGIRGAIVANAAPAAPTKSE